MSVCMKCESTVFLDESFTLRLCNHIYCHKCLCNHIKSHIDCKIKCPVENCNKNISDQIIRKCLTNSQIEYYEQISLCKSTKSARICLTSTCLTIMFIEDDTAIFHCQYCDQPNCLKCKKRHYPSQCGDLNHNEDAVEAAAKVAMNRHRRKALEEQMKNNAYIPNPESFECEICESFILPRAGLIIRNCLHNYCKSCFEENLKNVKFTSKFKCPKCDVEIDNQEIMKAIGTEKMIGMVCKEAAQKMFCCKYPDCDGMWDNHGIRKGSFICPVCKHSNCLDCEDFHEGQSCNEFRQSKRYINAQEAKKKLAKDSGILCNCGRYLIKKEGCGALNCDNCGNKICVFTGKLPGNNGPDTCGCTTSKTCHRDCIYGCFPE